jgi:hypothetical protein
MRYINCIEEWEPKGPVSVDLVHLRDGRVLGINSDCVVLYDNLEDFETCATNEKPTINLYKGESK